MDWYSTINAAGARDWRLWTWPNRSATSSASRSLSADVRLIGPGGAGKSTIGAALAAHLDVPFVDLDRRFVLRLGDIGEYIDRYGYDAYARENVETFYLLVAAETFPRVVALSSGFMTYAADVHPEYQRLRCEIEQHPNTFILLPSFDRDACIAETVRRQVARPFGRASAREETVIRTRFEIYMTMPMPRIETMGPVGATVGEIVLLLSLREASLLDRS
jgi:shikimate kinase